jgi:hypothetical protein
MVPPWRAYSQSRDRTYTKQIVDFSTFTRQRNVNSDLKLYNVCACRWKCFEIRDSQIISSWFHACYPHLAICDITEVNKCIRQDPTE